jgi:hypothetical protein
LAEISIINVWRRSRRRRACLQERKRFPLNR